MEKEKENNFNKNVDKIFENLIKISKLFDFKIKNNSNNTSIACSFVIFYFSNFKYKLILEEKELNTYTDTDDEIFTQFLNDTLTMSNSQFTLPISNKIELINFILYFITEFDLINEYIEYLTKINRKYINIKLENLLDYNSAAQFDENSCSFSSCNFLQNFNNLNFLLKGIKKQVDSFINLSYKLNELKKEQTTPINNLKIEEFLLFNDSIFEVYKKSILDVQSNLEVKFYNANTIMGLFEDSIILYEQFNHCQITNINRNYDEMKQNVQIDKIKQIFSLSLKESIKEGSYSLLLWIENLEEKLASKLSKIKEEQSGIFKSTEISNNFTNLALELENFINGQIKSISLLVEEQFEEIDSLKEIRNLYKDFSNYTSEDGRHVDGVYENITILKEIEHLKIVYELYLRKFEEINNNLVSQIKSKFDVYNLKLNNES